MPTRRFFKTALSDHAPITRRTIQNVASKAIARATAAGHDFLGVELTPDPDTGTWRITCRACRESIIIAMTAAFTVGAVYSPKGRRPCPAVPPPMRAKHQRSVAPPSTHDGRRRRNALHSSLPPESSLPDHAETPAPIPELRAKHYTPNGRAELRPPNGDIALSLLGTLHVRK